MQTQSRTLEARVMLVSGAVLNHGRQRGGDDQRNKMEKKEEKSQDPSQSATDSGLKNIFFLENEISKDTESALWLTCDCI